MFHEMTPATFQKTVYDISKGIRNVNIMTYIDDFIILSSNFEQHISDFEADL